jgi:2-keto-4-pentenoate hydratase/2-oxohepta-3-ene-1,7-dioic acid hydratase in catechol pathway
VKLYTITAAGEKRVVVSSRRGDLVDFETVLTELPNDKIAISRPLTMLNLLEAWDFWRSKSDEIESIADSTTKTDHRYSVDQVKIEAPISRPPKIVGIAFNNRASERFRDRYQKTGNPGWFIKCSSCVVGQDDEVVLTPEGWSNVTTPEVELGIVIGKKARWVSTNEAYDAIAGYTIVNDVTAQDLLVSSSASISPERYFTRMIIPGPGESWEKDQLSGPNRIEMKQWDTFAPMGPCIVTKDEIDDPHDQSFSCEINGATIMQGQRLELIWDVPQIVHMASLIMTLEPGDIISSGNLGRLSPKGVLNPGDKMAVTISKIGTLRNSCVESPYPASW